jgi:methyl-accepting chemotaxis protein PixJ
LRDRVLNDLANHKNLGVTEPMWDRNDGKKVLLSYTPVSNLRGTRSDSWGLTISRPLDRALAPLDELRWIFGLGTLTATVLAGAIILKNLT